MSTRQRIQRTTLGVLAVLCGVAFAGCLLALAVAEPVAAPGFLLSTLWLSGLGGLGLGVAACGVADDSTEDPEYFGCIVAGIRAEWQRADRGI